MIVTLKDGSKKEYAEAKSVIDIAYDISERWQTHADWRDIRLH